MDRPLLSGCGIPLTVRKAGMVRGRQETLHDWPIPDRSATAHLHPGWRDQSGRSRDRLHADLLHFPGKTQLCCATGRLCAWRHGIRRGGSIAFTPFGEQPSSLSRSASSCCLIQRAGGRLDRCSTAGLADPGSVADQPAKAAPPELSASAVSPLAQRLMVLTSCSGWIGLPRWSSIPASRQRAICSGRTLAVRAMIGVRR